MKKSIYLLLALLLSQTASHTVLAQETRYIRDTLFVPLRSGQGVQFRILHRGLPSGTKIALLETNEETGYSRVRTEKGEEGWLQSQYLVPDPTSALKLATVTQQLTQLRANAKPTQVRITELQDREQQLLQNLKTLQTDNVKLGQELAEIKKVSANAIDLDRNNKVLVQDNETLKSQLDVLKAENQRLSDNAKQEGFIQGVIAVCIGVFLALIIPVLKPKRGRSEWG